APSGGVRPTGSRVRSRAGRRFGVPPGLDCPEDCWPKARHATFSPTCKVNQIIPTVSDLPVPVRYV
ncbi:MAG: hypothetical protein OXF97_02420, partial [Nitrospira sp.]|nr:hypothetical protein [Nitrospira sp.]